MGFQRSESIVAPLRNDSLQIYVHGDDRSVARQHAWIVYRSDDQVSLFEPAARDRASMIQPWSVVKDDYITHFAVNGRSVTSAFVGCLSDQLTRRTA
jgi:hypothetical protein